MTFDNIRLDDVLATVRDAIRTRRRCVITTPNLNFVIRSRVDPAFGHSIVRSDLSLVDGMPLVWAGRWLGVGVQGRVAGADLFERLRESSDGLEPIKAYLFGGPPGAARLASDRLNAEGGGIRCVGHHDPGYGGVEEISRPEVLREINASGADFLVLALGAHKGQSWIERNGAALEVPVISHLGAVINFTAGTIRRAPVAVQRAGLEWAWRIYREPALWRRYGSDGWRALGMAARTSIDAAAAGLPVRPGGRSIAPALSVTETADEVAIELAGAWREPGLAPLRAAFQAHAGSDKRLSLDLGAATVLDSSAVALLMVLRRHRLDAGQGWRVSGASARLRRMFSAYGAGDLLGESAAR